MYWAEHLSSIVHMFNRYIYKVLVPSQIQCFLKTPTNIINNIIRPKNVKTISLIETKRIY